MKSSSSVAVIGLTIGIVAALLYGVVYNTGFAHTLFPNMEKSFASQTNSEIAAWNEKIADRYNIPVVLSPTIAMTPAEIQAKAEAEAQAQAEAEAARAAEQEAIEAAAEQEG